AVIHGAKRFKNVCELVKAGKAPWQFIEFMACPGGCVCGGGQPIMPGVFEAMHRSTTRFMASCRNRLRMMSEQKA
ncbi:MAG: iron hydrogenase, partial [Desulfovibrio sp.]|nr:iron hydrogenase [Desulfovibrio sp.]